MSLMSTFTATGALSGQSGTSLSISNASRNLMSNFSRQSRKGLLSGPPTPSPPK